MTQRILQGAAATLTYTLLDADGIATDAAGALTVKVTKADGTVVIAAGTATTHGTTGVYTVALTAAQTATLDLLTATWTDAAGSVRTTLHEIVGGYVLTFPAIRAFENLGDQDAYKNAKVIEARAFVEDEAENICDVSFVPRYRRVTVSGSGDDSLIVGVNFITSVRNIRTYSYAGSSSYTELTPGQLASIVISPDGAIRRGDYNTFTEGAGNIVVDVETCFAGWGADLPAAMLIRLRDQLTRPNSNVPERAKSYNDQAGFAYDLGAIGEWKTGLAVVDAVYERYSKRKQPGNEGSFPASRPMVFDAQRYSLFNARR